MSAHNIKQAVPFFGVTDIQRSLRFYVDGLGFAITLQWKVDEKLRWCYLVREGAEIMLQEFLTEGKDANVPTERLGVGMSIYFICEDALDLYEEFNKKGLAPSEPFVGNSMWVTQMIDPNGYLIFFESPTDVKEETRYTAWKTP